jgi:hypothetical protein
MDKIKYYLDYDKQTTQVLFLGIEKNSEHSIELELDDEEYAELANDLDFMFIKNGKPVLDQNYKTKYLNGIKNRNRIDELKSFLAATDWKVTVNAELFQVGLPLKYPNLHAERQAWRDEINELEGE